MFKSVQAVVKNAHALDCRVCSPEAKCSSHERVAYEVVEGMRVGELVVECKLLRSKHGAVDVFLPHYNLLVMVDGEGHLDESHHSTHIAQQAEIDGRFNQAAAAAGFNLLRVSYCSMPNLEQWLHHTIESIKHGIMPVAVLTPRCKEMQELPKAVGECVSGEGTGEGHAAGGQLLSSWGVHWGNTLTM